MKRPDTPFPRHWRYYIVLLVFYVIVTFLSEKVFNALSKRVRRGMPLAEQHAT